MVNRSFVLPGVLLACLSISGCPCDCAPPENLQSESVVTGTITDASTGLPLAGVTVQYSNDAQVMSDADGKYSFTSPSQPYVYALKRQYHSHVVSTSQFPYNTTTVYDFSLVPGDITDLQPPLIPVPHAVNRSYSDSVIEWNYEDVAPDFASFMIYRGNEEVQLTLYGYAVTQPVSDSAGCYSVSAMDASGNESPRSTEMCAIQMECAPTDYYRIDPTLTVNSSSELNLRWGVPTSIPQGEFNIYRDGSLIKTLAPGENHTTSTEWYNYYSFSDTSLSPVTKYCYSVTVAGDQAQDCNQLCMTTEQIESDAP